MIDSRINTPHPAPLDGATFSDACSRSDNQRFRTDKVGAQAPFRISILFTAAEAVSVPIQRLEVEHTGCHAPLETGARPGTPNRLGQGDGLALNWPAVNQKRRSNGMLFRFRSTLKRVLPSVRTRRAQKS